MIVPGVDSEYQGNAPGLAALTPILDSAMLVESKQNTAAV